MNRKGLALAVLTLGCSGGGRPRSAAPIAAPAPDAAPAPGYVPPAPALVETAVPLDLPVAPSFEPPAPMADGEHTVRETQLKGATWLDMTIAVDGYVIWKYDCVADGHTQKEIDADPTLCERPNFLLADAVTGTVDDAIRVVEVPRKPNAQEKKYLSKKELKDWPKVPVYQVGDHVRVEGTWALRSPHGFSDPNGVLVYAEMTAVTP